MSEPIHIISLGAGVQSSTMALMAAKGEIGPMPVAAVFADTQAEPESVYLWLSWLCGVEVKYRIENGIRKAYMDTGAYTCGIFGSAFPVHLVTHGSLEKDTLVLHERKDGNGHWIHSGIPHYSQNADGSKGHGPRQCTHDYKIQPILKHVRQMVLPKMTTWRRAHKAACKEIAAWNNAVRAAKKAKAIPPMRPHEAWTELQSDPLVIQWIGISLDEAQRMKESRLSYIKNIWPLIDLKMSRVSCLEWMKKNEFPKPPRSACVFCPYHSDTEWMRLKTEEPKEFDRAVIFEKEYQRLKLKVQKVSAKGFYPYLHDSRTPLETIDFKARLEAAAAKAKEKSDRATAQGQFWDNPFVAECEGMCGV